MLKKEIARATKGVATQVGAKPFPMPRSVPVKSAPITTMPIKQGTVKQPRPVANMKPKVGGGSPMKESMMKQSMMKRGMATQAPRTVDSKVAEYSKLIAEAKKLKGGR